MAYALCGSGLWRLPGARLVGGWPHSSHRLSHRAGALSPQPLTPESTTVDAARAAHSPTHRRTPSRRTRFRALPALASLLNRLRGRPPLASRAGVCVMSRRAGKLDGCARHASPAPPRSLAVPPARRTRSPPRAEQRPHPPGLCAHCARRTYTVRHTLNGPQHEP